MALHKQGADFGVEASCHKQLSEAQGSWANSLRLLGDRDRVEVDKAEKGIGLMLHPRPIANCPEVVAQVKLTSWLNARQDPFHMPIRYALMWESVRIRC